MYFSLNKKLSFYIFFVGSFILFSVNSQAEEQLIIIKAGKGVNLRADTNVNSAKVPIPVNWKVRYEPINGNKDWVKVRVLPADNPEFLKGSMQGYMNSEALGFEAQAQMESAARSMDQLTKPKAACSVSVGSTSTDNQSRSVASRYETCTPEKNDYFETQLKTNQTSFSSPGRPISNQCIQIAMNGLSGENPKTAKGGMKAFNQCNGGLPNRTKMRACISENYVNYVSKNVAAVNSCFLKDTDPNFQEKSEDIISLMAHESGIHPNVQNASGGPDMGPGQLIPTAIEDLNKRANWSRLQTQVQNCDPLIKKSVATQMPARTVDTCKWFDLSGDGFLKNLVYTYAYVKASASSLRNLIFSKISGREYVLDDKSLDQELFLSKLAIWTHNTGAGGMSAPIRPLIDRWVSQGKKIAKENLNEFLQELSQEMKNNPHSANSSEERKRVTSGYYASVQNKKNQLTANGTRRCI